MPNDPRQWLRWWLHPHMECVSSRWIKKVTLMCAYCVNSDVNLEGCSITLLSPYITFMQITDSKKERKKWFGKLYFIFVSSFAPFYNTKRISEAKSWWGENGSGIASKQSPGKNPSRPFPPECSKWNKATLYFESRVMGLGMKRYHFQKFPSTINIRLHRHCCHLRSYNTVILTL